MHADLHPTLRYPCTPGVQVQHLVGLHDPALATRPPGIGLPALATRSIAEPMHLIGEPRTRAIRLATQVRRRVGCSWYMVAGSHLARGMMVAGSHTQAVSVRPSHTSMRDSQVSSWLAGRWNGRQPGRSAGGRRTSQAAVGAAAGTAHRQAAVWRSGTTRSVGRGVAARAGAPGMASVSGVRPTSATPRSIGGADGTACNRAGPGGARSPAGGAAAGTAHRQATARRPGDGAPAAAVWRLDGGCGRGRRGHGRGLAAR